MPKFSCDVVIVPEKLPVVAPGKLMPGEGVSLRFSGISNEAAQAISGPYIISQDLTLEMPILSKPISVKGCTAEDLRTKILAAYRILKGYEHLTVVVLGSGCMAGPKGMATVGGEVSTPRSFRILPGMNILDAIEAAGGATEYANLRRVKLLRGTHERLVDIRDPKVGKGVFVQAGDKILLPSP